MYGSCNITLLYEQHRAKVAQQNVSVSRCYVKGNIVIVLTRKLCLCRSAWPPLILAIRQLSVCWKGVSPFECDFKHITVVASQAVRDLCLLMH